jgi:hypothetical protein
MHLDIRQLHCVAVVTVFMWLAAGTLAAAQAPAPLPTDKILDHDSATPARKACFEFLPGHMRKIGKRAVDEMPDLSGRNICLYARKFGYRGAVE